MKMRRNLAISASLLVVLVLPLDVSGNHLQTDSGKAISFDHKSGNDYWVEVVLGGADAGSVSKVEAQTGRPQFHPWVSLTKRSWGAWAESFGIDADADVRFRATWPDGTQAVSCWFTHPEGVEHCPGPVPDGTWRASTVGDSGPGFGGDSAIADADGDGRNEIYVPNGGALLQHERDASGVWRRTTVMTAPPQYSVFDLDKVAVGDTQSDGVLELYSAGWTYDGSVGRARVYWSHWNGTAWYNQEIAALTVPITAMSMGDIEDDGDPELYVSTGFGSNSGFNPVYRIDRLRTDFDWNVRQIANLPSSAWGMWGGDADRDGDQEMWISAGAFDHVEVWRVDGTNGTYSADRVAATAAGEVRPGIVAGDGDNDGQQEVYVLSRDFRGNMLLLRFAPSNGWLERVINLGPGEGNDLFLGDADNDGSRELYVSDMDGRLVVARWTGSTWFVTTAAQLGSGESLQDLVIGDGDSDGRNEVYGDGYDVNTHVCCALLHLVRIAKGASPPPAGFDATFTGVRGNEWWIQANVAAVGGTLSSVHVRLAGGAWQALTKQSWGGWAASYHATQGTVVQFRATSTTGATDLSDCYVWIPPQGQDASKASCGSTTQPFDATFTGVKGNEWWVQANVGANERLSGVDARVNCGSWIALDFQSWGSWAKSFHVPNGAKVDFRARSQTGASDVSGGYTWPQATPTSGC